MFLSAGIKVIDLFTLVIEDPYSNVMTSGLKYYPKADSIYCIVDDVTNNAFDTNAILNLNNGKNEFASKVIAIIKGITVANNFSNAINLKVSTITILAKDGVTVIYTHNVNLAVAATTNVVTVTLP